MLDPATVTVVFADLQEFIVARAATMELPRLRRTVGALGQLAAVLQLPVVISAVPGPSGDAPEDLQVLKEIREAVPGAPMFARRSPHLMADAPTAKAIAATGRRTLAICGVASEIVVVHAAVAARQAGYEVQVIVDACSGFSPRTEDAAFRQIERAGGITTAFATFATSMVSDFTTPAGAAVRGIFRSLVS